MDARRALGRYGEDLAARQLRAAGMAVLERNWRCRDGEVDIIARDRDALVICEVKTRQVHRDRTAPGKPRPATPQPYQDPMAALSPRKAARLRRLAARWLSERWLARYGNVPGGGVRIDLIGVLVPARGAPQVQHVKGVL
ncbi:YraN family protein [Streptomyces sp. HNM0574]|uniref:YraN family protein n=1 Tax=Streptomyces sp. HNM0574 TaxID=2714954 RepID=UPI00146B038F|nr:YraN family protein [Streptomyces sp. HNM0574]NLU69745.1 YraN family protein [Streptomyces sp. HNM0574]